MELTKKAFSFLVGAVVVVFFALVLLFSMTERVSEGHVAVVYTPSDGAKDVLDPGWHVIGLLDKTYEFSVRAEVIDTKVEVNTSDGKKITIPVTYNMSINGEKDSVLALFKAYGARGELYYSETVVQQQLRKVAKETIARYSTLDIFTTKLTEAGDAVGTILTEKMEKKGFFITDLALLSPKIDKKTAATIDAQIQAQQTNELKKLELENEKIEADKKAVIAEGNAREQKIKADGDAAAEKIAADAEAYANQKISQSLTETVLKKMELEARKTHGWVTIQGQNTVITDAK